MQAPAEVESKVNLLIVVAGLGIGGAEVVVQRLVQNLDRRKFNVRVCCIKVVGSIGAALQREGVEIIPLADPDDPKVDYLAFLKLRRVIRRYAIDIVHTHTVDALADAAVCKLLTPGVKLIHTFHFGNYPHITPQRRWMEGIFSRLANKLVAVGEVQRSQLRAVYRFSERRLGRVWNGVVRHEPRDGAEFRAGIGAEDAVLVGTVASLIEQKGLRDLLAVAARFRDGERKVVFVVIGEGHLRAELEALRAELGLDGQVVFAGWVADAAEVALPAFDVFFQCSHWEAMSIAVLEAMAAGKAVLATRVGENGHIIEQDADGLLAEPRDIDGMSEGLRRLVDDAELRSRLGEAAARKVARQFTVEHMTRAYEEVYLSLLPSRSVSP